MLFASLRVLGGTLFFLAMAATVGIPSGRRGPVAAQPNGEPLLGLDLYRPAPEDNPLTPEKVSLGRRLFHERLLSRDRTLSCEDDAARALASYVRTILSGDSPYDRLLAGWPDALSPEAQEGLRIFRGKGNCSACHAGPHLTDDAEEKHALAAFLRSLSGRVAEGL